MRIKKMNRFVNFITGGWASGITLSPFGIYIKEEYINYEWIRSHEKIHWKQQMEMLIIFFYLWYLIEWALKFIKHGNKAYYLISFEIEAHLHNNEPKYLETRKHFAWFKYMNYKKQ